MRRAHQVVRARATPNRERVNNVALLSLTPLSPRRYAGGLATSYLPVVALIGVIALLPLLLRRLAIYAGAKSRSDEQKLVLDYFFAYQVANVFLITVSNSIFQVLNDITKEPSVILKLLGEAVPNVAYYFASLIIVKALVSNGVELARPLPNIKMFFVRRIWDGKKMSMRELTSGARSIPTLELGQKCVAQTYTKEHDRR